MEEKKSITVSIEFRFPTEQFPKETAILEKAINSLPDEVSKYLVENPIMFSGEVEGFRANALCISHESFKNYKYLVHFNYHIWKYPEQRIIEIIFHEIAHCYLRHNPGDLSWQKSKKFVAKQENEVERLVNKWVTMAKINL